MAQIEESVARYLEQLDTADRQEPSEALQTKTNRLKEKIETLKQQMRRLERLKVEMLATPDQQISLTDPDARSMATSGRPPGTRQAFSAGFLRDLAEVWQAEGKGTMLHTAKTQPATFFTVARAAGDERSRPRPPGSDSLPEAPIHADFDHVHRVL